MRNLLKSLTCVAALLAGPAFAQDTATEAPATETPTTKTPASDATPTTPEVVGDPTISMGEPVTKNKVGTPYAKEEFGDWAMRCVHAPEGQKDPCQLYQLLHDGNGNSVAEFSVFALTNDKGTAAGATIVTPLETLLTQQLRLRVDEGQAKRYPFAWCSQGGCFSRIGFTADDIASFKRGVTATITLVPVAAPDKTVDLKVSLKGFTAGFDAVLAYNNAK